jgi:hypothetical protein
VSTIDDLDPSLNAGSTARFWDISIPTLNRDVRERRHPPADYTNGQYRFWKLSTLVRERERRIGESAHKAAAQRQEQLDAAARARTAQRQKRERQATTTDAA